MKLYKLTQDQYDGWDTYDSCVVAAKNEEDAKTVHPSEYATHFRDGKFYGTYSATTINGLGGQEYLYESTGWADDLDMITVELIGTAVKGTKKGCIVASFNAG